MAYDHAFSPISIGELEIRNRIVSTAHTTGYPVGGRVSDELIAYHRARAEGGVGLIVLEGGSVHPSFVAAGLRYDSDDVLDGLSRLVDTIRPTGARLFGQLMHGGVQSAPRPDGSPPLSASATLGPGGAMARAMTTDEIDDVVAGFVNAGRLLAAAGLDGCELHLGHGYLLAQFLSSVYNRRTDEYGESLENRMRFTRDVLTGLAKLRGPNFVVGIRIGPEAVDGGIDSEAVSQLVDVLERDGLIDYVSLTLGNYAPTADVLQVAPMEYPSGYQLAWNEATARRARVPVIVTGRFRTVSEVDEVVSAGIAQLVGMTRAQIADPEIARKTRAGHEDRVRPCIACNECVLSRYTVGPLRCAVNPDLPFGLGTDHVAKAQEARRVLVVGGGPAGMEAARTAALRGHQVTLAEADSTLGGVASLAARKIDSLSLIDDVLRWQRSELDRLGVDVRLNSRLEPKEILDYDATAVIVATGSHPGAAAVQSADPGREIPGASMSHVVRAANVFALSPDDLGGQVVIVDSLGTYVALGIAEYLVGLGVRTTVVTHFPSVGHTVALGRRVLGSMARLHSSGLFTALPLSTIVEIQTDRVDVRGLGSRTVQPVPADTVVLVLGDEPESDIPAALAASEKTTSVVGDALAPRGIRAAISNGHRAALEI